MELQTSKVYGYQYLIVNSPSALGLGMIHYCMELAEVQNVPKHAFPINFRRMQNNFVFLKRVTFGSDKQIIRGLKILILQLGVKLSAKNRDPMNRDERSHH